MERELVTDFWVPSAGSLIDMAGVDLIICISSKFPGDAGAAAPETTL